MLTYNIFVIVGNIELTLLTYLLTIIRIYMIINYLNIKLLTILLNLRYLLRMMNFFNQRTTLIFIAKKKADTSCQPLIYQKNVFRIDNLKTLETPDFLFQHLRLHRLNRLHILTAQRHYQ